MVVSPHYQPVAPGWGRARAVGGAGAVGGQLWRHEQPVRAVNHGEGLRMGEDGASSSPHPPHPAPHRWRRTEWRSGEQCLLSTLDRIIKMLSLKLEDRYISLKPEYVT